MADTKQSPPRQVVKDFVRKPPSELTGSAHPCDDPGLSPIEFLQAIYRDPLLPMSIRIDAARGVLPYTEPRPASISFITHWMHNSYWWPRTLPLPLPPGPWFCRRGPRADQHDFTVIFPIGLK